MVALFLCVLSFSLFNTVRGADAVDAERTREAVAAAVDGEVKKIVILTEDSGIWDDATRVVYGGLADPDFLWSNWGVSTADQKYYDTAIVVDSAGRPLIAYRKGRMVRIDLQAEYGAALTKLLAQSKGNAPSGGIVRTRDGLVMLGVSEILPTTRTLDPLVPADGPYRLIFSLPFDAKVAAGIGRALLLEDVRIGAGAGTGSGTAVRDAAGQVVAHLSWAPSQPGLYALKRALPWIALAVLVHLTIAAFVSAKAASWMRQLADKASLDGLSGLPNRRAMRHELQLRLAKRERLALALIDLDGFKGVNDNFGHNVGDRLIKLVSELLTELAGTNAMVARLGGDEFAVLASGPNALVTLEQLSHALLDHVGRPFKIDERTVLIGASIGLASAGISEFDANELMRRADVAMYAAKDAGKMRLIWYDEGLDQQRAAASAIESELRASFEVDEFELVYQPVVSAGSKEIETVEALLRWRSPTRGEVGPGEFIPIAEETGLIDRIGMAVLRRACLEGIRWSDVKVGVNVSKAQLRNPHFADQLSDVLAETGFPAERLELEITETFLIGDPAIARRTINRIRQLGVGVVLDDFGSGCVSIGFLRQFGLSGIKLDRSLVAEASTSAQARSLVQAIVAAAGACELRVAAEGVESEAQADLMRVAGCRQLQGWLISRAVSAAAIDDRLLTDGPASGRYLRLV